jgi:hypothetical protein
VVGRRVPWVVFCLVEGKVLVLRFSMFCDGTTPLLMHNARLVDPLDTVVKQIREVSSKRIKTDADHAEIAQLEWLGGIYYQQDVGPFVPATNLQKCLIEGARLSRDGKKIERGVVFETLVLPLEYEGPSVVAQEIPRVRAYVIPQGVALR